MQELAIDRLIAMAMIENRASMGTCRFVPTQTLRLFFFALDLFVNCVAPILLDCNELRFSTSKSTHPSDEPRKKFTSPTASPSISCVSDMANRQVPSSRPATTSKVYSPERMSHPGRWKSRKISLR